MQMGFVPNVEIDQQILEKYGRNLTELAKNGKLDPVIGKESEIRILSRVLSRRLKNNPVLVGEPGTGKTVITEGLAIQIIKGEVPESLKNKEIYELDMGSLIAGTKFQGEFEERIKAVMNFVAKANGKIILFIDEIHTLIGAGRTQGALDAANIIKPMMARGEVSVIGATTPQEYKRYIEDDPAFERRMQKIIINEPSVTDTINILRGLKEKYENYHGVKITDSALIAAAELSSRYIQDRFLPDKAIDLMDEACSLIKTQIDSKPEELDDLDKKIKTLKVEKSALGKEKSLIVKERLIEIDQELALIEPKFNLLNKDWIKAKDLIESFKKYQQQIEKLNHEFSRAEDEGNLDLAGKIKYDLLPKAKAQLSKINTKTKTSNLINQLVNAETISLIVSKITGIPLKALVESERDKLVNLETSFKKYIKGQDHAINIISNVIRKSRVGINDPNKPIGSFIFMGPTGVGKTEVAKKLSKILFNSEDKLIRFDMSEYSEGHSISKLIGSPPGYVGFEEGGKLTELVRKNPYSVLLFDEIEKAHPEIFNIFLQILDDGMLTDSQGRKINFKNTIIIMTTNISAEEIPDSRPTQSQVIEYLETHFRLEFINRLDEIVVFNKLTLNDVAKITKNELNYLSKRMKLKNFDIRFDDLIIQKIVREGFNPIFGARPLKRYISKNIENVIVDQIISHKIKENIPYEIVLIEDLNQFLLRRVVLN